MLSGSAYIESRATPWASLVQTSGQNVPWQNAQVKNCHSRGAVWFRYSIRIQPCTIVQPMCMNTHETWTVFTVRCLSNREPLSTRMCKSCTAQVTSQYCSCCGNQVPSCMLVSVAGTCCMTWSRKKTVRLIMIRPNSALPLWLPARFSCCARCEEVAPLDCGMGCPAPPELAFARHGCMMRCLCLQ